MSKLVTELHIIGENGNMFDTDMEYVIPLYQRAYAWEDKQLTQLIEDINDVAGLQLLHWLLDRFQAVRTI